MPENLFTGSAFNKALSEGKLMGTRCKSCGVLHLPPRPLCPDCLHADMEWLEFSGRGRLLAHSVIFTALTTMGTEGYSRVNPYCVGIVQLDEGPSISAQIQGIDANQPEKIEIGMPVSAVFVSSGKGEARKTRLAFKGLL